MFEFGEDKNPSHLGVERPSLSDIVGQTELKEALLAVAANDDLDGLLVRGEKGTAKSTAVRALADLLPTQRVVAGCPFGCPPGEPTRQCADCRERADPETAERPAPLVTLPLGATRDRVAGTLSVADALEGDPEFDPGLLARANRGILYVDEINLLDDHLVDVLLDAAASGVNRVERDGVSVVHPAAFTLVGTMNPEEGDLRPQLRDRFALSATVSAPDDLDDRVAVVEQALGRENDAAPAGATGDDPGDRLAQARDLLDEVTLSREYTAEIAEICRDAGVDGHRADIATARAARTLAALDGRPTVVESDVRQAAELALSHRLQSRPFEDAPDAEDLVDDHFDGDEGEPRDSDADGDTADEPEDGGDREAGGERDPDGSGGRSDERGDSGEGDGGSDGGESAAPSDESDAGSPDEPGPETASGPETGGDPDGDARGSDSTDERVGREQSVDGRSGADASRSGSDGDGDSGSGDGTAESAGDGDGSADDADDATETTPLVPGGKRATVGESRSPDLSVPDAVTEGRAGGEGGSRTRTDASVDVEGPRVRTERTDGTDGVDAAASVRAAGARGSSAVESRDLRASVRRGEASALVVFAVDASASMRPAMEAAKGTVMELLRDAYEARDEVAFVAFAGENADVLLPPTDSVTLAARHLKDLPTGDRTPLPAGLRTAADVVERAGPAASVVVVVTDGRANVADGSPLAATRSAARRLAELDAHTVVVDAGEDTRASVADAIVAASDGERVPLSALSADRVDAAVGTARETQL